jgi:hypothetical protein
MLVTARTTRPHRTHFASSYLHMIEPTLPTDELERQAAVRSLNLLDFRRKNVLIALRG